MDGIASTEIQFERRQPVKVPFAQQFGYAEAWVGASAERDFRIRAAASWGERSSASTLISRMYAGRGYKCSPLAEDGSPHRLTLVATDKDAVVGTLTIGFDSDKQLLADQLFPNEINAIRMAGRQVCEFTKLAIDGSVQSQRVLAAMFHVAFIHAHRMRGCDNLLIEVNPRHSRYYQTKLGFKVVGPQRLNHRVNAPAVLLSLDLWHAQEQIDKFGGKPEFAASERSLYPYSFSAAEEAGIVGRLREQQGGDAAAWSRRNEPRRGS